MKSSATTVKEYLDSLPADRRKLVTALRKAVRKGLGKGYKEGIQYGMIGYFVPHSIFPDGYHCDPKQPVPFAGIGSQKNYVSLYLMCVYGNKEHETWFKKAWTATGKRLDMGKSCVRIKKLEDVPSEVVTECIRRVPLKKFIAAYEDALATQGQKRKPRKATAKATKKKVAKKKAATRKAAPRKRSSRKR